MALKDEMGDDDLLSGPSAEFGHISLNVKLLSQSVGKLTADLAGLAGEMNQLRLEIAIAAKASNRSAWALVGATIALVFATLVMAWPMWFTKAPSQSGPSPAVSSPAPKSN